MRLRIATCTRLSKPDLDEAPLVDALQREGVTAEPCAWDSPSVDWDRPVATVIRSTWNYHRRLADFLAWCERVGRAAPLWNDPAIVRENAHKRYLLRMQRSGIGVAPTELFERGAAVTLENVLQSRGWNRFVIKPAVSAGSFGTRVFTISEIDAARAHMDALLANDDVLVQPYLSSVETYGERSLVWIDGEFTHAVRKAPRFSGDRESVTGPLDIEDTELDVARRALDAWQSFARAEPRSRLLYGRVDLVRDDANAPLVAEVELIEPSLFLDRSARALQRLARAIAGRLREVAGQGSSRGS